MKRIVVGVAAHVDAGKTTLSEALLYRAGEIRKLGRVDNGDTFLDNNPIERRRGITIFSKQAVMRTENAEYTLLDTPGHVDFSAEAERALTVLDCAVLVISGVDGVQSHTRTLWELLSRFGVPVFVFVNKMDISHRSEEALINDLHGLDKSFLSYNDFPENTAEYDEDCMNALLGGGEIPDSTVAQAIAKRHFFPVVFGSALKSNGLDKLMELLEKFASPRERYDSFAAIVHKISTGENGERLTHLKINGGTLKTRSIIDDSDEKITQIRIYNGASFTQTDEAHEGQICAVTGLTHTYAGQALGVQHSAPAPLVEAFLSCKINLPEGSDIQKTYTLLKRLEDEDPQLRFSWSEQHREITVSVMGDIQLEVLQNLIAERFGLNVTFGEGNIAYRETISEPVIGSGHYEPLRHYAEAHLLIEPLPTGSGVIYAADCPDLDEQWQNQIISALRGNRHIGVLTGSPLTDVKITLIAGRAHQKHTEGGDFRQASFRALRQGLAKAKSVLLEPFYRFRLTVPISCTGRAMTDLERMGAQFSQGNSQSEMSVLEGVCPVSEMRGYQREVVAYTHGEGILSCRPDGYLPCHNPEQVINEIGYNFENDVENSPDSVFCSHGAGYLVKWNEADGKMHVKPQRQKEAEEEIITERAISTYRQRLATDKELMEIFERTYGKIKRPEQTTMRRDKRIESTPKTAKPIKRGPEFLLVDGYNIIFSWDDLAKLARENMDSARAQLINILCNYQGFRNCNVILVFDAYKVKGDREVETHGNISVVYTKTAETADMYIEKTAQKLSAENRVRVATSDGTEQLIILGSGAIRVSAREFRMEVDEVERAIRKILDDMH
ncbi:MAG: NYN domain-containing protein [Oscillospiraceae bacterium]